ncbi:MAG: ARMT1-like domain-containing protein [Desulfovibrio sp.]|jgi:uncharacterized protein with ATP-grasp and redox domains|nr:ARMT1-like domain-containing protein [Desulfovibrio sp.]
MSRLPDLVRVSDIQLDEPVLEAWIYHFLMENNIEYLLSPSIVASPEQLRFMVALRGEAQIYSPCDDVTFFCIYRKDSERLAQEYLKAWRFIIKLIYSYALSKTARSRIVNLCRYRFQNFFTEGIILPSRMIKRLVKIVLTQCGDPDPFREKKSLSNSRASQAFADSEFQRMLHGCPDFTAQYLSIPQLRQELHFVEMSRLMRLSTFEPIWNGTTSMEEIAHEVTGAEEDCACLRGLVAGEQEDSKKFLFIPDVAGGFIFDIHLIFSLLKQGHRVILALKDAFYFHSPTLWDLEREEVLKRVLGKAFISTNGHLTKNELLQLLREHHLVIISDGLSEQLNLCRASVSFARAWKECDMVIAKGRRNMQILMGSSHEFTRDVICYWRDADGAFQCLLKPRANWVRKFSEQDILLQSKSIIAAMRCAKEAGKTVIFYSAIIGSIPGQTQAAIEVVNVFVGYLRDNLDNAFIINPAEHFEHGMDGDDLMYMWEHVQRSGFLDVWRFQTVEDIEKSFALLKRKVPSIWSGKDSTFSTGCTKEIGIALDVQRKHPELQIIGPAAEKFFRRRDYGIGKYFDSKLK